METQVYVTIWSKAFKGNLWVIERTHCAEYVKNTYGLTIGKARKNPETGRSFSVYPEGVNPNKSLTLGI